MVSLLKDAHVCVLRVHACSPYLPGKNVQYIFILKESTVLVKFDIESSVMKITYSQRAKAQ